eukprot:301234-Prymnesium_polylepis.1
MAPSLVVVVVASPPGAAPVARPVSAVHVIDVHVASVHVTGVHVAQMEHVEMLWAGVPILDQGSRSWGQ